MSEICEKYFPEELKRLQTIPGIKERAATSLIAEIGTDMSKFETANHLAAWSGLRPRNDESNKKIKSRKITPWQRISPQDHHTMCMGCQSDRKTVSSAGSPITRQLWGERTRWRSLWLWQESCLSPYGMSYMTRQIMLTSNRSWRIRQQRMTMIYRPWEGYYLCDGKTSFAN